MKTKTKRNGFWRDFDNFKREIEYLKNTLGHFPTYAEIESHSQYLAICTYKYHGGMNNVRLKLNEPILRASDGYWSNFENIKNEAINIVNIYGAEKFNIGFLREIKKFDFLNAIVKHNVKISSLRKELNLPTTKHPFFYYKDINIVLRDVKYLFEKYGGFPEREVLLSERMSYIHYAISKWHGGKQNIYKLLGIEFKRSHLETMVKFHLDKIIDDDNYIENGRKILLKYGLSTYNKLSNNYLEIDRFYYNAKTAIEINGRQHYKIGHKNSHWSEENVKSNMIRDEIKRKFLEEQGIKLIIIPYNRASFEFILNQIKSCGSLKIKKEFIT